MAQWHVKSKRKKTGGRRTSVKASDKTLAEKGRNPAETKIGTEKKRSIRNRGGQHTKLRLNATQHANVLDKKAQKHVKAEILSVNDNPANRKYTRQNIITKGAKIKVKIGSKEEEAIVTSRPGQSGMVQAVLSA
jgi:small subunit ribosomal protein S8e